MPLFTFETITPAQALTYNAVTDALAFAGGAAGAIRVSYDPSSVRIAVTYNGRTVVFGGDFAGETGIIFPDGTTAAIAGSNGGTLTGGSGPDALFGGTTLRGNGGADTLTSAAGGGTLSGGAGNDLFICNPGDASAHNAVFNGLRKTIVDWEAGDRLSLGSLAVTAFNYRETTADSLQSAYQAANGLIQTGAADVVAVQAPFGTMVFVDSAGDDGLAEDMILLAERTLSDVDPDRFVVMAPSAPFPSPEPGSVLPPVPPISTPPGTRGTISGNMDAVDLSGLLGSEINDAGESRLELLGDDAELLLRGFGFTYDSNDQLAGGVVTDISYSVNDGAFLANLATALSAAPFLRWVATNATQEAFATIFAGHDLIDGGEGPDLLRGLNGNDRLRGRGGSDTLFGGPGNDVIFGNDTQSGTSTSEHNYLRGDEGDDYILGADGFDDINGNIGNDTGSGGLGDDWVVGGKDNDLLFGDAGNDIVYGNLGADTCHGGDGADIVRGGQENDILRGGAGDDYVSGDRGDDTVTGGTGADRFHTFGEAGIDRVTDFSLAQGDRVLLDAGTQYSLSQVGADTVISMTGGGQMILVGVQLASLTPGWIFGA